MPKRAAENQEVDKVGFIGKMMCGKINLQLNYINSSSRIVVRCKLKYFNFFKSSLHE